MKLSEGCCQTSSNWSLFAVESASPFRTKVQPLGKSCSSGELEIIAWISARSGQGCPALSNAFSLAPLMAAPMLSVLLSTKVSFSAAAHTITFPFRLAERNGSQTSSIREVDHTLLKPLHDLRQGSALHHQGIVRGRVIHNDPFFFRPCQAPKAPSTGYL